MLVRRILPMSHFLFHQFPQISGCFFVNSLQVRSAFVIDLLPVINLILKLIFQRFQDLFPLLDLWRLASIPPKHFLTPSSASMS